MERENNTGVLFRNEEVKTEKHPTHWGYCKVDDKERKISGWVNTVKEGKNKGKQVLSLKLEDSEPKKNAYYSKPTATAIPEEEVPF